jgi:hypothetical protein
MNSLKQRIVEKLEHLPATALQEVLNYIAFLEKEPNETWGEIGEDCPVEYVGGVLVVKARGAKNLETAVQELREERIKEITSW